MKTLITSVVLALALAAPAVAQQQAENHAAHQPAAAAPAADMTEGEIRKLDGNSRTLTIRHGEIRNLGMPAMTMVFAVKDAAMLRQLKVGDKIRFVAEMAGSGLTVTEIRPIP